MHDFESVDPDDRDNNTSANPHITEVMRAGMSRRSLLRGGVSALAAVGVALIVMIVVRKDFAAVAAGLATAALVRAAGF